MQGKTMMTAEQEADTLQFVLSTGRLIAEHSEGATMLKALNNRIVLLAYQLIMDLDERDRQIAAIWQDKISA